MEYLLQDIKDALPSVLDSSASVRKVEQTLRTSLSALQETRDDDKCLLLLKSGILYLIKIVNLLSRSMPVTLTNNILDFVLEIITAASERGSKSNSFVVSVITSPYLDIIWNDKFPFLARLEVLKSLNTVFESATPAVIDRFLRTSQSMSKLGNLLQLVMEIGDYEFQVGVMEFLFRAVPRKSRQMFAQRFIKNVDIRRTYLQIKDSCFEVDCRQFLNYVNNTLQPERRVISLPCNTIRLGSIELQKPGDEGYDHFWLDCNLGSRRLIVFCENSQLSSQRSSGGEFWDALTVAQSDIHKFKCWEENGLRCASVYLKSRAACVRHMTETGEEAVLYITVDRQYDLPCALVQTFCHRKVSNATGALHIIKQTSQERVGPKGEIEFLLSRDGSVGRETSECMGQSSQPEGERGDPHLLKASIPTEVMSTPASTVSLRSLVSTSTGRDGPTLSTLGTGAQREGAQLRDKDTAHADGMSNTQPAVASHTPGCGTSATPKPSHAPKSVAAQSLSASHTPRCRVTRSRSKVKTPVVKFQTRTRNTRELTGRKIGRDRKGVVDRQEERTDRKEPVDRKKVTVDEEKTELNCRQDLEDRKCGHEEDAEPVHCTVPGLPADGESSTQNVFVPPRQDKQPADHNQGVGSQDSNPPDLVIPDSLPMESQPHRETRHTAPDMTKLADEQSTRSIICSGRPKPSSRPSTGTGHTVSPVSDCGEVRKSTRTTKGSSFTPSRNVNPTGDGQPCPSSLDDFKQSRRNRCPSSLLQKHQDHSKQPDAARSHAETKGSDRELVRGENRKMAKGKTPGSSRSGSGRKTRGQVNTASRPGISKQTQQKVTNNAAKTAAYSSCPTAVTSLSFSKHREKGNASPKRKMSDHDKDDLPRGHVNVSIHSSNPSASVDGGQSGRQKSHSAISRHSLRKTTEQGLPPTLLPQISSLGDDQTRARQQVALGGAHSVSAGNAGNNVDDDEDNTDFRFGDQTRARQQVALGGAHSVSAGNAGNNVDDDEDNTDFRFGDQTRARQQVALGGAHSVSATNAGNNVDDDEDNTDFRFGDQTRARQQVALGGAHSVSATNAGNNVDDDEDNTDFRFGDQTRARQQVALGGAHSVSAGNAGNNVDTTSDMDDEDNTDFRFGADADSQIPETQTHQACAEPKREMRGQDGKRRTDNNPHKPPTDDDEDNPDNDKEESGTGDEDTVDFQLQVEHTAAPGCEVINMPCHEKEDVQCPVASDEDNTADYRFEVDSLTPPKHQTRCRVGGGETSRNDLSLCTGGGHYAKPSSTEGTKPGKMTRNKKLTERQLGKPLVGDATSPRTKPDATSPVTHIMKSNTLEVKKGRNADTSSSKVPSGTSHGRPAECSNTGRALRKREPRCYREDLDDDLLEAPAQETKHHSQSQASGAVCFSNKKMVLAGKNQKRLLQRTFAMSVSSTREEKRACDRSWKNHTKDPYDFDCESISSCGLKSVSNQQQQSASKSRSQPAASSKQPKGRRLGENVKFLWECSSADGGKSLGGESKSWCNPSRDIDCGGDAGTQSANTSCLAPPASQGDSADIATPSPDSQDQTASFMLFCSQTKRSMSKSHQPDSGYTGTSSHFSPEAQQTESVKLGKKSAVQTSGQQQTTHSKQRAHATDSSEGSGDTTGVEDSVSVEKSEVSWIAKHHSVKTRDKQQTVKTYKRTQVTGAVSPQSSLSLAFSWHRVPVSPDIDSVNMSPKRAAVSVTPRNKKKMYSPLDVTLATPKTLRVDVTEKRSSAGSKAVTDGVLKHKPRPPLTESSYTYRSLLSSIGGCLWDTSPPNLTSVESADWLESGQQELMQQAAEVSPSHTRSFQQQQSPPAKRPKKTVSSRKIPLTTEHDTRAEFSSKTQGLLSGPSSIVRPSTLELKRKYGVLEDSGSEQDEDRPSSKRSCLVPRNLFPSEHPNDSGDFSAMNVAGGKGQSPDGDHSPSHRASSSTRNKVGAVERDACGKITNNTTWETMKGIGDGGDLTMGMMMGTEHSGSTLGSQSPTDVDLCEAGEGDETLGDVPSLLRGFSADLLKQLKTKERQIQELSRDALKLSNRHIHQLWLAEKQERAQTLGEFRENLLGELSALDNDVSALMELEKRTEAIYFQQVRAFKEYREKLEKRVRTVKGQHEDFHMKSQQAATHSLHTQKAMEANLRKDMKNLETRFLLDLQEQQLRSVKQSLQKLFY